MEGEGSMVLQLPLWGRIANRGDFAGQDIPSQFGRKAPVLYSDEEGCEILARITRMLVGQNVPAVM